MLFRSFEPKAPFDYLILNDKLSCVQFKDFTLKVKLSGNEIPAEVYLITKNNKFKLKKTSENSFEHHFKRINADVNFKFLAGGYKSTNYTIKNLLQPKVVEINIDIQHPKHTNKKTESIKNCGDIIVSEGSIITWSISMQNSSETKLVIDNKTETISSSKKLKYSKQIFEKINYQIISANSNNLKDTLKHSIRVVKEIGRASCRERV